MNIELIMMIIQSDIYTVNQLSFTVISWQMMQAPSTYPTITIQMAIAFEFGE